MSIERCKAALPLPDLWRKLGLQGEPKRSTHSPFRDDSRASFSVFQKDGKWFFKDHAIEEHHGDEVDLIRLARNCETKEAIKIYHEMSGVKPEEVGHSSRSAPRRLRPSVSQSESSRDAAPSPNPPPRKNSDYKPDWSKKGTVVNLYDYYGADGALLHQTVRFEPKNFSQRRRPLPNETPASDGWVYFIEGIEPVLYRLPELLTASEEVPIFFVEGEKDADALRSLGFLSTTVPMGSNKWRDSYTATLTGKWVVVMGDHDGAKSHFAGQKHVKMICEKLHEKASRLGVIELKVKWPACPEKGDLSDWLKTVSENPGELGLGDESSADDIQAAVRARLAEWAEEAKTPAALRFGRCFGQGERGALQIYHDLMAESLMEDRIAKFAGESWWSWQKSRWRELEVQREARRWIMEAISSRLEYREVMTSAMISSIEDLMMSRAAMHPDQFNRHDPNLINVSNGMLDVRDMTLRAHDPKFLSTVQVPHRFDSQAVCPAFLEWLKEMLPAEDVRGQIQEIFGYCLSSGLNFHKFFFFFGDGGTGKSTCVDVLTRLIGDENTVAVRLQDLDNAFNRSQLVGKRLYLAAELNKDSLKHIDLVKAITSGDPIHVEKKHKDGYTYRPQGKFIMTSNVRATTSDTTEGFFRRLCQVTFENKIPEDKKDFRLLDKLCSEMDGILYWSLEGLKRLMERGRFEQTADSKNAAEMLQMHRASAMAFYNQCIEEVPEIDRLLCSEEIYDEYKVWCEWQHVKPYFDCADSLTRELLNRFSHLRDRRKRTIYEYQTDNKRRMCYAGLRFQNWRIREGVE